MELKRLEEELFNHCKLAEGDVKANSGRLLSELESMVTVSGSSNASSFCLKVSVQTVW